MSARFDMFDVDHDFDVYPAGEGLLLHRAPDGTYWPSLGPCLNCGADGLAGGTGLGTFCPASSPDLCEDDLDFHVFDRTGEEGLLARSSSSPVESPREVA